MDGSCARRVLCITQLTAQHTPDTPARVQLQAGGEVRSAGWQQPQLRLLPAASPTATLQLEFVATPPDGMAAMVISPISATLDIALPANVTHIEVLAETNRMSIELARLRSR